MLKGQERRSSGSKLPHFLLTRSVIIIVAGLTVGMFLYVVNASVFSPGSMPMPFGAGVGVVLSGSMEPALSVDDLIIVRRFEDYSVGDIVVYRGERAPVVHRIVEADRTTVITKGDANNAPDSPISPSDIEGRVIGSIPKAGVIADFLRSPLGVILVLGAAFLLLELSFRRERAEGEREAEKIREEIVRLREGRPDEEKTEEISTDL